MILGACRKQALFTMTVDNIITEESKIFFLPNKTLKQSNTHNPLEPLTLKDPFISESCIEIKIELNFYFHTSLLCLKRAFKAFIKPFEAPQRSVKIKI